MPGNLFIDENEAAPGSPPFCMWLMVRLVISHAWIEVGKDGAWMETVCDPKPIQRLKINDKRPPKTQP